MKNYVIFKGVNSNTYSNLIISELPCISKPELRVDTTEIDGKDGDIIDELGYASYDKTLKIALKSSENIDEIIKFFSGSGNIVFSNEPDKYYKAYIYEQIDFERLLRFKEADITIHVQPFKYLLNEEDVVLNITNQTSLTVNNQGLEKSKPILKLYGSGTITVSLNGLTAFTVTIDEDDDYIVIDSMEEEACNDTELKNRNMSGEFPLLETGNNTISWTGSLTKIEVTPNSRWL